MASSLSRQRSRLVNALVSALATLLSVALVEAALRTGLISNRYRARLQGEGDTKTPRRHRLLILGDSFIYQGGELSKLLVRRLTRRHVHIVNLAVGGMGPIHYLRELEAHGARFRPEIILVSYYVGNDLTDVQYRPYLSVERGPGRLSSVLGHFYLYHAIKACLDTWTQRSYDWDAMRKIGIEEELIRLAQTTKTPNPGLLRVGVEKPRYLLDNLLMETDENEQAWQTVQRALIRIQEISRQLDARLAIVVFPGTLQVSASHAPFYRRMKLLVDEGIVGTDRPQARLRAFCAARQIPCLDLLPVLRAHAQEPLYRDLDDHLNDTGNALAADAITTFLNLM